MDQISVPCNSCTACCRGDAVVVHEALGDHPESYLTEPCSFAPGHRMLAHQTNGDCIYLDRGHGCTIWARRPYKCRIFDCRRLVARFNRRELNTLVAKKVFNAEVVRQGRRLRGAEENNTIQMGPL